MTSSAARILVSMAALFLSVRAEAETYNLAPDSPWNMHYAEDSCSLRRAFGKGDEQVLLELARNAPRTPFEVRLFGKIVRIRELYARVAMTFGEAQNTVFLPSVMAGKMGDLPALFLSGKIGVPPDSDRATTEKDDAAPVSVDLDAAEDAVRSASFQFEGRTINLELGSLRSPMAAMRECTRKLVEAWGLDPAVQEHLLARPVPKSNPNNWLSSANYPRGSARRGEQALVNFRLLVDAEGNPTQCAIQQSAAKTSDFGTTSCDMIMRRARFDPARTPDGTPVASYYINRVIFRMN